MTCCRPIARSRRWSIITSTRPSARKRSRPRATADDATLIRRLTLDLAGRIPTAAESRAFVGSTDPDKRARLVDRLMASAGFVRHQATELDTMLMAGSKGSLRDYLVQAVGENRPWDRIFRELMLPDQTDKVQKAAAEYLRQGVKDLDRLTADVSSTFFGVNISCAQCHDHPLVRDWKQDHFYGMKSFLSRTFVNGNEKAGFLGEHAYGTIRFKTTDDVERQARMMFLTGRRVDEPDAKEPSKEEQKKEKEGLDRAKKENVSPAAAQVQRPGQAGGGGAPARRSRVLRQGDRQSHLAPPLRPGTGHAAGPDALGEPAQPSRSFSAWLARDTATHGYDLRRLIRGLVLSEAYAREHALGGRGAAQAVALRRGPRASPDAHATGDLAPAGDRRPGKSAGGLPIRTVREADRGRWRRAPARSPRRSRRRAATPRSAWPRRLLFSNGKRISQRPPGRRAGPAGRASETDRGTGRADRPGRSQRALTPAR